METILVIDDEAVIREPIAAGLRAEGYKVTCAGDGQTALSYLQSSVPDLILLDIRMPRMDGISVLRALRAGPTTSSVPVLLLSSTTDRDLILQAAKLGVQGYILKSAFSMNELLNRIRRITPPTAQQTQAVPAPANLSSDHAHALPQHEGSRSSSSISPPSCKPALAAPAAPDMASWPRILTREQTLERLDHVASGKTLAGVVAQLMAVANSTRADLADVVRVIESDPILATRVLQLANSASTGSRGRVSTVEESARNLGLRGIQNMAISIGIFGAFPPDEGDGFNTMRCWQHSFAVAELLNILMSERNPELESMNHLVGLCHDLGEILLRQHFAVEYAQVLTFALAHRLPIHQVESVALGIRHPELISRLLTRIGLPTPAVQAIREFFERQIRDQAAGLSAQTQALSWANLAAHGLLLATSVHEVVRPITRSEWRQFSSSKPPPVLDAAINRNDILMTTNVLARLPEQEERRLLLPLIPRHAKRIWYVRPQSFIEFDPLAFALTLCGNTTIAEDLPQGEIWKEIDGIVLVGLRPGVQGIIPVDLARATVAAGRADLRILCLVGQEIPTSVEGAVQVRSYPISLEDLGEWLTSACSGQDTH